MRKKHLAVRLDELERRVRELEARPQFSFTPSHPGPSGYQANTASTTPRDTSITGTHASGPHSVGITLTGAH